MAPRSLAGQTASPLRSSDRASLTRPKLLLDLVPPPVCAGAATAGSARDRVLLYEASLRQSPFRTHANLAKTNGSFISRSGSLCYGERWFESIPTDRSELMTEHDLPNRAQLVALGGQAGAIERVNLISARAEELFRSSLCGSAHDQRLEAAKAEFRKLVERQGQGNLTTDEIRFMTDSMMVRLQSVVAKSRRAKLEAMKAELAACGNVDDD